MALGSSAETHAEATAGFDTVHARLLQLFPELVTQLGAEPDGLLQYFGLNRSKLVADSAGVGYRQFVNLLEHAAAQLKCPDFGLRLARQQGGGSVFGPVGTVMQNSSTLREALDYVQKHSHAHSLAARIRLVQDSVSRTALVTHDILLDRLPNKCQAIEQLLLLAQLNAIESTGGKARVREVRFRHQALSSRSVYRRYFGCEVRFDQPLDGVVFSEQDLLCPIVNSSARLYETAVLLIERKFTRVNPPMNAQVRGVILQLIGTADCSNEVVAAELHIHPRTLHRRLKSEGTSFQAVKDAVRRDLAVYYLQQTNMDLTHVAQKVGYAEHAVLTRSCIRWFSVAPSQLRLRDRR